MTHLVVTDHFAGTERYVCRLANASAERGWRVDVIGGDARRMRAELADPVRWHPGATLARAALSLHRIGRQDVCHAHLTSAEIVATALRSRHRGQVLSTRHIAAPRGSSWLGGLIAPWVERRIDRQISISEFVAGRIESGAVTVPNGVPSTERLWHRTSRTVLVLQRLEAEKHTRIALHAWHRSGLADLGWRMHVVGDGSQRSALEHQVRRSGMHEVHFRGARADVTDELAGAGLLLAPAPAEPLGLSVLEAMAAGVPVVATMSGGHLETARPRPLVNGFEPEDVAAAAACLRRLALDEALRERLSTAGRERQAELFTVDRMAEAIHRQYAGARS